VDRRVAPETAVHEAEPRPLWGRRSRLRHSHQPQARGGGGDHRAAAVAGADAPLDRPSPDLSPDLAYRDHPGAPARVADRPWRQRAEAVHEHLCRGQQADLRLGGDGGIPRSEPGDGHDRAPTGVGRILGRIRQPDRRRRRRRPEGEDGEVAREAVRPGGIDCDRTDSQRLAAPECAGRLRPHGDRSGAPDAVGRRQHPGRRDHRPAAQRVRGQHRHGESPLLNGGRGPADYARRRQRRLGRGRPSGSGRNQPGGADQRRSRPGGTRQDHGTRRPRGSSA
jgi:hypothetical protein